MTPFPGGILKSFVLALVGLLVFSLPLASTAAADVDQCSALAHQVC